MLQHVRSGIHIVSTSEYRTYLGGEHIQIYGLRDKVVTAHVHGHDYVHVVRSRSDKYYRHVGLLSYLGAPVKPVKKREINVEQHQ